MFYENKNYNYIKSIIIIKSEIIFNAFGIKNIYTIEIYVKFYIILYSLNVLSFK